MLEYAVLEALRDVIDPELGINIVELGLVYGVRLDGDSVTVEMTMTSPACPMGAMLLDDARDAIHTGVPGIRTLCVQFVWDPPWQPDRMSESARQLLGWAK